MEYKKNKRKSIQQIGYRPPVSYKLDVEVFSIAELRRRASTEHLQKPQRIEFHLLIFVTNGKCSHMVDFRPVKCKTGTFLTLRPAQTQQFDVDGDWDGWLAVFRPEFLLPLQNSQNLSDMRLTTDITVLPEVLQLTLSESEAVAAALSQMHEDAKLRASFDDLHNLLRHQLYTLLLRLHLLHDQREVKQGLKATNLIRFKRFQQVVEKNLGKWHQVSDYANAIGCSEKSLTRAVFEITGTTAKAYIATRINLEAKRLLVHTTLSIGLISEKVGFDEATNFVKFFKREVGLSPGNFRQQYTQRLSNQDD